MSSSSVGISSSSFAKSSGELIGLVNELRASGASLVLDVPRIVVIGNQSAGKSSLVEAISGIRLPRADSTCTRVPSEVRLTRNSEPWKCRISLRFETDENGVSIADIKEKPFGKIITDPTLVESTLRKAQLALLNPSIAVETILDLEQKRMDEIALGAEVSASKKGLSFSSNVIVIDISGPEVVDLSFIDLPGIISNVRDDGDPNDITLIENLVTKYITGSCIILQAMSMKDDLENQRAGRMAKLADPEGVRTVGVLTKSDTVDTGEHEKWFKILRGTPGHALKLGWFATKQPRTEDLKKDLSFETTRKAEKDFFETEPWASTGLRSRFGVVNLTNFLSEILSQYILNLLPSMLQTTNLAMLATNREPKNLPPPPSQDPVSELQQIIYSFSTELSSYTKGLVETPALIQNSRLVYNNFRENIAATEPTIISKSREEHKKGEDDSMAGLNDAALVEFCESRLSRVGEVSIAAERKARLAPLLGTEVETLLLAEHLDGIRDHINRAKTKELPYNTPYGAKKTLIVSSVQSWEIIAHQAIDELRPAVFQVVEKLVAKYFGRYSAGPLRNVAGVVARDEIDKLFATAKLHVEWLMQMESDPFTMNDNFLSTTQTTYLAQFKKERQQGIVQTNIQHIPAALSQLSLAGYGSTAAKLSRLLDDDKYKEELEVAAFVLAYWNVAYKRIIDIIPRALDLDIIAKLSTATMMPLQVAVGMTGSDNVNQARIMLAENKDLVMQREELMKKKARLESAKKALSSFGMAH